MGAFTLLPSTFGDVANKTLDFSQPYPDFHSEVQRRERRAEPLGTVRWRRKSNGEIACET